MVVEFILGAVVGGVVVKVYEKLVKPRLEDEVDAVEAKVKDTYREYRD